MKTSIQLFTLALMSACSVKAAVIIGGATGNGNLNNGATSSGALYSASPNWHWANGDDTTQKFLFTSLMGGSPDPGSGGGYVYKNRTVVNDTGYTITAAGDLFTLSYIFGAGGNNWDGTEYQRSYLFTTAVPVDASLTTGQMIPLSSYDDYYMDHPVNGQWTSHSNGNFYVSTEADIGKTIYLATLHTDPGTAGNPRIENVLLEVFAGAGPTNPPPSEATNVVILAGSTGNADFNAGGDSPAGAQTYDQTPNWFNASGDESLNFTQDNQMGGSTDPGPIVRGGMPWSRKAVNNTGHTITSTGETFNVSFDFGAGGNGWDDDESIRIFLFTASATVDGNLTTGQMTELGDASFDITSTDPQWTSKGASAFYTADAGDVGKTVYLGFDFNNPAGATLYPRIDTFNLNVDIGSTNTNEPPVIEDLPTAWDDFVDAYGLSGFYETDADADGVSDRIEFAHGGNPTNPADWGSFPGLGLSNNAASLISLETSSTNPGIAYTAEWTDNLSGTWRSDGLTTNTAPSINSNYNTVAYSIDASTNDHIFMRNRIFPTATRPNILFILADDLGYADVSFNHPYSGPNQNNAYNGTTQVSTPELDSLANNGAIFTSAYVVHPFCGPSRMGLMAGRYPHDFGGPFNLPDDSSGNYTDQGIGTNEVLLSTMLQDAGYFTGMMGKWHLGQENEFHPNNRGFDDFYGFLGGGIVYWGPYQAGGWDYKRYPQHNGVVDTTLGSDDHITDVLTDKGIDFINQAAATEDPFFLFMSYNAPHSILVDGSNDRDQAKAEDLAAYSDVPDRYRRNYLGLVRGMDRCVGELVQTLKDTGQYDNTMIVFLSDNGGRYDQVGGWGDNGVLRGRKGDVTDGGFRTPMFIHWPNMVPPGVTFDHPVTALDFYPTFARLAETDIPVGQNVVGKDIWENMLLGEDARPGEPIYTVTYSTSAASVGIRQDNWKALKLGTQNWRLYDITNDISESVDVSATYPSVLSDLVSEGATWSSSHVQPLWWNSPSSEIQWNNNNMPHYETVFVLP